jgi:hypothetical protein
MQPDWVFVVLVAGSFVAAAFNAAFSIGGAMIILATTTTVLPVAAIVPLHSGLLIGSTFGRVAMFWRFIDWKIVNPFLIGSVIGTALGAKTYFALPENAIAIAIAIVMLVAIWLPEVSWRPKLKHPWAIVGFGHSLLSTLFAYGALFVWYVGIQDFRLRLVRLRLQAIHSADRCIGCSQYRWNLGGQTFEREAPRARIQARLSGPDYGYCITTTLCRPVFGQYVSHITQLA